MRIPLPGWANPDGPLATIRRYYGIFLLAVTAFVVVRGLWDLGTRGEVVVLVFYFVVVFPGLLGLYGLLWAADAYAVTR